MQAIETFYKGHKFRSRLEARWAVFFDELGIKYEYEPEGFIFEDGTKYLPDFYLPESKQFFEVKGVMEDDDMHKIKSLISSGHRAAVGFSNFRFLACDHWGEDIFTLSDYSDDSYLTRCRCCGKYSFIGGLGAWDCPCCGAYDGDHYISFVVRGTGEVIFPNHDRPVVKAIDKAKSARFEYGENGGN